MNPQDISGKKFEKSTFGYKPEEVDEYLRDIAIAYAKAVKEKEESELKIVKLVEKINEYRNDEDAIRDALLVSQKQGNRIIAEAKEKADAIVAEAEQKRDALLADIQNDCEALKRSKIEQIAEAIRAENDKLQAVEAASKTRMELQTDKLNALKKEVTDFKRKLLIMLDEQVKLAVALPELTDEQIENIMSTEAETPSAPVTPAVEEEKKPETAPADEKSEQKTEQKSEKPFNFSEYKRTTYSADELKFGQNRH